MPEEIILRGRHSCRWWLCYRVRLSDATGATAAIAAGDNLSRIQPAAAVGGDYLDYFSLTDGTLGKYIGDVSGKGLPAALTGALAVGDFARNHKAGAHPSRVLYLLNIKRPLLRGIPGRYTAI